MQYVSNKSVSFYLLQRCGICHMNGANLGCELCDKRYHLPCVFQRNVTIIWNPYRSISLCWSCGQGKELSDFFNFDPSLNEAIDNINPVGNLGLPAIEAAQPPIPVEPDNNDADQQAIENVPPVATAQMVNVAPEDNLANVCGIAPPVSVPADNNVANQLAIEGIQPVATPQVVNVAPEDNLAKACGIPPPIANQLAIEGIQPVTAAGLVVPGTEVDGAKMPLGIIEEINNSEKEGAWGGQQLPPGRFFVRRSDGAYYADNGDKLEIDDPNI